MVTTLIGMVLSYIVATSSAWIVSPLGAQNVLSSHEMSLEKRYSEEFVNSVMRKNILLNLGYMRGIVKAGDLIDWAEVEKPFLWTRTLEPNQTVSYHDIVLEKYKGATPLATVHFAGNEGFLSDGWIIGDGVCHLASLISWAARDAGLFVEAPTSHDFREIPEVPKEQGVSVYSNPLNRSRSEPQNLYIQNTLSYPVEFVFTYDGEVLEITVRK